MNTDQLKSYFNNIAPIPPKEWDDFASRLKVVNKPSEEIILRAGQVCNFVSFINKGLVRVYEIADGVEINRTFFMQGFFATEYLSFLSRQPSKEYLEVVIDAELVMIDYQHLQNMYVKYKSFERLGRLLSESLYMKLREKLERYQSRSPEERYQQMINEHPEFLDQIPHYHLASYLGIKPQSLSRIRKRLK